MQSDPCRQHDPHSPSGETPSFGPASDGRFRIEELIGRGGMANVYRAVDVPTGNVIALKRLRPVEDPAKYARSLELFEREFHTLAQLAHPRIVQVHDYGVYGGDPCYTMELLDGGDLQERAPLEWRRACAIARDVCSALSLLHSRKMVYRDMSPRNVRLTSSAQAKVIDFGAMIPMGPSKQVVGTAGFCAPEVVELQPLDARSDLYSLGATLYFMLTGRRAYPARDFRQLRELWQAAPRKPSEFVADVPPALDALVMDLLQFDQALRPASAGEVMERLCAIGGESEHEQVLVSQAYLSTPTLVGRDGDLARVRKKIAMAQRGHGGAVLIKGAPGIGRSRLLEACALEGKLAGLLVLRADALDAQSGNYGVARALALQLIETAPDLATEAARAQLAVLGHALPELLEGQDQTLQVFEDPDQLRIALQQELRRWMLAVARKRPLMIAVDDVGEIDEPSAALVTLLSHEAPAHPLLVTTSMLAGSAPALPALRLLAEASAEFVLGSLSASETERLLRSVFGDVPHVQMVSDRLHALAEGNPRDVLLLAQHLLERGLVRYQAGAWSLPASIDPADLPSSMAQALRGRVDALGQDARELAQALALCPDQRFAFDECLALTGQADTRRLIACLDQLALTEIVRFNGERYAIAQQAWLGPLRAALDAAVEQRLHLRIAGVFQRRGQELRAAQHLLRGGDLEQGVSALVEASERSQRATDVNPEAYQEAMRSLPADWFDTFELAIQQCAKQGRPRRDAFILRTRQTSFNNTFTGTPSTEPFIELFRWLEREAGLDLCAQLDPSMEPRSRALRALELAQARHESRAERERVHEPRVAIAQLARAILSASGVVASFHDHALLHALPLLTPYAELSPLIGVTAHFTLGLIARMKGRNEQARLAYRDFIERLSQPDRAGLGASYHRHMNLGVTCSLALLEAGMGLESSLAWASAVEADSLYQVNAWQIRMIHHLWHGRVQDADACRQRVELLRIQNSPRQMLESVHLFGEATAYAAIGDLTRMKQTLAAIEPLAASFPGWMPFLHYARGEYQRLRGDLEAARAELERGLSLIDAGMHQIWAPLAGALLRTLHELGSHAEAISRGRALLAAAETAQLGYLVNHVRLPLALSEAASGEHEAAVAHAQAAIDTLLELGSSGLNLGLAYETRARVASYLRDQPSFERYAALCAEQYRTSHNRALVARYDKLVADARKVQIGVSAEIAEAAEFTDTGSGSAIPSQISSMMEGCHGPKERARRTLELLLGATGCSEGFLYTLVRKSPVLTAQIADHEVPTDMVARVSEHLESEMHPAPPATVMTQTMTFQGEAQELEDPLSAVWASAAGRGYRPVVLSHATADGYAISGLALLATDPARRYVYPVQLAADLSRFACESGDVSAFTMQDPPRSMM